MASDLESFLLGLLDEPTTANDFMTAIPDALGKCNDDIYDLPLRPEAYAYIHLLERYRRTWWVLVELTPRATCPSHDMGFAPWMWGPVRLPCCTPSMTSMARLRGL
jgi:hypothetical protein